MSPNFLRLGAAALLAFLITQLQLHFFEAYLYDMRVRLRPSPKVSSQIELILIENRSVEKLKSLPTFAHHADLLEILKSEDPRSVVYIANPRDFSGEEGDQLRFATNAESLKSFYSVTKDMELKGEEHKLVLPAPLENIKVFPGPLAYDTTILAKDSVTRRMLLTYQGNLVFHPYLASQISPPLARPENIRGVFQFLDSDQVYVDFAPTGSYPRTTFYDVVEKSFSPGRFKDKIVFIGYDHTLTAKNYVMTPYSRELTAMTAVEAHANMVDTLLRNSSPIQTPPQLNLILTFLFSLLTIYIVLKLKPGRGLAMLGASILLFGLVSYVAFWPFGYWIPMAHPLLAVFLCYYFFLPYRLIIENRRSWELYEKNKLLTQVEELKNNFIGMMSHDLKTPLARIHGMTDIISQDSSKLSEEQQNAVKSIRQSANDLVSFITSILNFSRIESQGVELQLKSKDINSIIEETIHKYDYSAQQKKIEIKTELETLFSVKVDPDLIRQVISNLIENAIKYSPERSKVLVTTEESEGKIIIQVADQGQGIPNDEIPHIFTKFYRSPSAKTSPIKGSGLGLYLAKYFVELHGGSIRVDSQTGLGSTFTVELPVGR